MFSLYSVVRYRLSARQFQALLCAVVLLIVSGVIHLLPDHTSKRLGNKLSVKGHQVSQLIYYSYKTFFYDHESSLEIVKPVSHVWVNIEGFKRNGQVAIRLWGTAIDGTVEHQSNTTLVSAELADIDIVDLEGAARTINGYIRKQVEVDYYRYSDGNQEKDAIVVWLDNGQPLNQILVDKGFAVPHAKPPTNIINRLMMTYYWEAL